MTSTTENCLIPKCKYDLFARGLCKSHFNQAYHKVSRGKMTWEQLEEVGFALPKRKKNRRTREELNAHRRKEYHKTHKHSPEYIAGVRKRAANKRWRKYSRRKAPAPGQFIFSGIDLIPGIDPGVCRAVAYFEWFARKQEKEKKDAPKR